MTSPTIPQRLLTKAQVCALASLSARALDNSIARGEAPAGVSISGREKRWSADEVHAWIDKLIADAHAGRLPPAAQRVRDGRRRGGQTLAAKKRAAREAAQGA